MAWRRFRDRGGWQPRSVIAIAVVWALLWDRLSVGNLLNGLILGFAMTQLFPLPSVQYAGRPRPLRLLVYLGHFLVDLVQSSIQVIGVVLSPRPVPRSSVIEVPLQTRSDLYLTLVAATVGLTPGSVVVEARRGANVLYLHALGAVDEPGRAAARERVRAVERRLVRAIGSDEEIAQCAEGVSA